MHNNSSSVHRPVYSAHTHISHLVHRRWRPAVLYYPSYISTILVVQPTVEPRRLRVLPAKAFPVVRRSRPLAVMMHLSSDSSATHQHSIPAGYICLPIVPSSNSYRCVSRLDQLKVVASTSQQCSRRDRVLRCSSLGSRCLYRRSTSSQQVVMLIETTMYCRLLAARTLDFPRCLLLYSIPVPSKISLGA